MDSDEQVDMTFDTAYPNTPINGEVQYKDDVYVRFETIKPCWNCGQATQWASLSFEAHLCSQECADKKWTEFISDYKA